MKKIIFVAMMLSSLTVFAGNDQGNGGDTVVCKDQTTGVVKEEIFDLYEGRVLKHVQYQESPMPYLDQVREIVKSLSQTLGQTALTDGGVSELLERNIKNLVFLPSGVGLAPVNDINTFISPKNCQIVQTANFRDEDSHIYVDSDVWKLLSETQKAALLLHETIYEYLRAPINVNGLPVEITSNRTRTAVSLLISGVKFVSPTSLVSLSGNHPLLCETEAAETSEDPNRRISKFYVYPTVNKNVVIQFISVGDRAVLTSTTLSIENVDVSKWPNLNIESLNADGDLNSLMDSSLSVSVQIWPATPDHNLVVFRDYDGTVSRESFVCRALNIKTGNLPNEN